MPEFEILCLANSRKRQGRCVAGIRMDGQGWVRPTGWNAEGTLYPNNYRLPDGSEAGLLDVLRIRCVKACPEPHHPENWLIAQRAWELSARPAPPEALERLRASLAPGPELLGSSDDRIPYAAFQKIPAQASLAVVQPDDIRWVLKTNARGERRTRVAFRLRGVTYHLALTDVAWEQRLRDLLPGSHRREAAGLTPDETVFLTISLSEPFQPEPTAEASCYKLVAAVIVLPPAPSQTGPSCTEAPLMVRNVPASGMPAGEEPACSLDEIRRMPPRAYEKWSESEEAWLLQLARSGLSVPQIAALLQRQRSAIRSRMKKLTGE
jgi:hypothetical protein